MEWVQGGPGTGGLPGLEGFAASWLGWVIPLMVGVLLFRLALDLLAASIRRARRKGRSERVGARPDARGFRNPESRPVRDRIDFAAEQMRAVEDSGFERKPLLNREEARWLPVLERAAREAGRGFRVMAQVSLGEVIRPSERGDDEAQAAINSKRLDFGIFDARGLILCAVEHQGSGHYRKGSVLRDAVKREALRKAGVRVIETHPDVTEEGLRRMVLDLLGGSGGSPGNSGVEQPIRP